MPSTVVGLDIGRTAVRAVELHDGRRVVVRRTGRTPLPPGAVEGGALTDPDAVTEALRTLWRESRIGGRDVRLGVCSGSVLVRQIELDWMPPADLRRALAYQVADLLPVAVEDANLDHVYLGEHERIDPATGATRRMVRILLVATARAAVDELVRCVRAAGLRPTSADLSPLALVRAAARTAQESGTPDAATRSEAVIDVGADMTAVAVHTGGIPRFVRIAPGLGGEMLTRAVMDRTGLTWEQAEHAKADLTDVPAQEAVVAATRRLVADVRTTVNYHSSTDPEHVPTSAVLTGGGAAHPGLAEQCSQLLGIPVRRLDPGSLARVPAARGRDAEDARDYVVPLGLCLGAAR